MQHTLTQCMPAAVLMAYNPVELARDGHVVDLMCMRAALFRAQQPDASDELKRNADEVYDCLKGIFSKLNCEINPEGMFISQGTSIVQLMELKGAEHFNAFSPFACPHSKSVDFMMRTINAAGRIYFRTISLWKGGESRPETVLPMLPTLVMHEIMASWKTPPCVYMCTLLMESLVLEIYHNFFLPLKSADRANPCHPLVRELFLTSAYLFAQLDPEWDRRDTFTWLEPALAVHVAKSPRKDLRADLYKQTLFAINRVSAVSVSALKLRHFIGRSKPEDRPDLARRIKRMAEMDVGAFNFPKNQLEPLQQELMSTRRLIATLEAKHGPTPELDLNPVSVTLEMWLEYFKCQDAARKKKADQRRRKVTEARAQKELALMLKAAAAETKEIASVLDGVCAKVAAERAAELAWATVAEAKTLPPEVARALAKALLPGLETALGETVDCFVCLQPIDFGSDAVRFLTCCEGGSFACGECVRGHPHPPQAEWQIVRQTASIRRSLGL